MAEQLRARRDLNALADDHVVSDMDARHKPDVRADVRLALGAAVDADELVDRRRWVDVVTLVFDGVAAFGATADRGEGVAEARLETHAASSAALHASRAS